MNPLNNILGVLFIISHRNTSATLLKIQCYRWRGFQAAGGGASLDKQKEL